MSAKWVPWAIGAAAALVLWRVAWPMIRPGFAIAANDAARATHAGGPSGRRGPRTAAGTGAAYGTLQ